MYKRYHNATQRNRYRWYYEEYKNVVFCVYSLCLHTNVAVKYYATNYNAKQSV